MFAPPQLARRPRDEVMDAVLRLDPLVEVLVALRARGPRRASRTAAPAPSRSSTRGPVRSCPRNRAGGGRSRSSSPRPRPAAPSPASRAAACPCSCCRGRRSGRRRCGRLEGVVALAVHVELLVEALVGVVVVAERRVELHSRVEQRAVGLLELLDVVARVVARRRCCPPSSARTRSGKSARHSASSRATSLWAAVPVPLSPMTAKRSEPSLSGSARGAVAAAAAGGEAGGALAAASVPARSRASILDPRACRGGHATTSFRKSTTRLASESWRIRCPPTKRYSSGSGSFGSLASRSGGTVDSGAPSG